MRASVPNVLYNSVAGKELLTRMRGWRSTIILTVYMGVLGAIAIGFLIKQAGPTTGQSSDVGPQLFQVLCFFQLGLILFITPSSTAGAISGERQRQTWDLLLVTHLSSLGIVVGKLVAGLAFDVLLVLASLPLFSLVFLFGGVAPVDIFHVYLVFLVTILWVGIISLFVSSLSRRLAAAMIVSNIIMLVISFGIALFTLYLEDWGQQGYLVGQGGPPALEQLPPLTPLAEIDPLVALASALPNSDGTSFLGGLNVVHHALGLPWNLDVWGVYSIVAVIGSGVLLAATTLVIRNAPRWLLREAAA